MKIRVYYEDTDLGGIVYHANYLKFCERARSELFFKQGLVPVDGNKSFVVRHMELDFINSARLADILEVKTTIIQTKKVSLTLLQEIYKNEIKIFSAKIKLVYLDNGKPTKIPENHYKILNGEK